MIDKIMTSDDGVAINYAQSEIKSNAPWLVLIIPFGLKTVLAKEFFDKFAGDYNVMTWESRLILADEEYQVKQAELSSESHLADLFALLQLHNIESAILVGYCSGAGIALAAAAKDRQLFSKLLLVHGALDDNVNASATFKLAEALVKADKEFDLLILPSQRHGYRGAYMDYFRKKRWNYFVEHLLEADPIWEFEWNNE